MAKEEQEHDSHGQDSSPEFGFDNIKGFFSGLKGFFLNKKIFNKTTLIVALLLVTMFSAAFFRCYSLDLPITDKWASDSVANNIRGNVEAKITADYPNLPTAQRNKLIDSEVQKYIAANPLQIEKGITDLSEYFKSKYQNADNHTYLFEMDPYMFMRYVENIMRTGQPYDTLKDGKPWDTYMFAPVGGPMEPQFHVYFTYYVYKIVSTFSPNIPLLNVMFLIPAIVAALAVIPAFFIVKKRAGIFGGFIAALIVAIHPVFLGRTPAGFSDTDAYVVFFVLYATWFFMEAFESGNIWKRFALAGLAALMVGLFSFTWSGWWFILDLIVVMAVGYFGFTIIRRIIHKHPLKKIFTDKTLGIEIAVLLIFVLLSAFFVPLFSENTIQTAINGPILRSQTLRAAAEVDYWPNIQTTVAELNPISIEGTIRQIGIEIQNEAGKVIFSGKILFFFAVAGILLSLVAVEKLRKKDYVFLGLSLILFLFMLLKESVFSLKPAMYLLLISLPIIIGILFLLKDDREIDVKYSMLLLLWFVASMFAASKGTRFVLLLVPAFGVAIGISFGLIHRYLSKKFHEGLGISINWAAILVVGLLCLFMIYPVIKADQYGRAELPTINDAWWTVLTKVNATAAPDAIVNSWWDFGHWFKYVSHRRVTVDGAGQDEQLAHWIGTVLISKDETAAVNTLRMLDCGGKTSYGLLVTYFNGDVLKSVRLMNKMMTQDEQASRQMLALEGMSSEKINELMPYIYCTPPEDYFITSGDMVGKAGVWAHFGAWDFDRSFIYVVSRKYTSDVAIPMIAKGLNISEENATSYYYEVQALESDEAGNSWIAPWPAYYTSNWVGCKSAIVPLNASDANSSTKKVMSCPIQRVLSQSGNTQVVLEGALIDLDEKANSTLVVSNVESATGRRLGVGPVLPESFLFLKGNSTIERVKMENSGFKVDVLVDLADERVLLTDPLLSESIFTKLFFLDGRYTTRFEKFTEETDVTGSRIIVWKVKW